MKTKNYWGNWVLIGFSFIFILLNFFLGDRSFAFPLNFKTYILPYSFLFWILIILTSLFGSIYWTFEWFKHPVNQRIKNINYVLFIIALLGIIIPIWWHLNYSLATLDPKATDYTSHRMLWSYLNASIVQLCAAALLILSFILMIFNLIITSIRMRKNQKTQETILDEDK